MMPSGIWSAPLRRNLPTPPCKVSYNAYTRRRDGVQPPRIRMTRGALAHMYVQGELYPQAISEIKNVLKEDPGRSDMQALLARACFQNGLKNDALDAASTLLNRYPYCLDANRVMTGNPWRGSTRKCAGLSSSCDRTRSLCGACDRYRFSIQ